MNKLEELNRVFKNLFPQPTILITAEVVSVEGDTCTVKFNDDLKVGNVRLRPTGSDTTTKLLLTPRIGSFVLLGSQSGDYNNCNVLQVEEPAKLEITGEKLALSIDIAAGTITINNGELGGLVKIQELKDNLQSIADFVNAVNGALPGAFSAIGAGAAANGATGASTYNNAMAGKTIAIKDMEDTNVTH